MRTCGPCSVPRGAARRTVPVQALREPAVGGALGPRLDYLARRGAGGRTTSERNPPRGVTATGVPPQPGWPHLDATPPPGADGPVGRGRRDASPSPNREPTSATTGPPAHCPGRSAMKARSCRQWQGGGRDSRRLRHAAVLNWMPIRAAHVRSAGRGDDPVLVDLPVDRRPGHAQ